MGTNYFYRDTRDSEFVIFEHLGVEALLRLEAFGDVAVDDLHQIMREGLKFAREKLAPAFQDGDRTGCRFQDGAVAVPPSFHEGWKLLGGNGWMSLCSSPAFGGQGLPQLFGGLLTEFLHAANPAITLYGALTLGAGRLIENFADPPERARFVEKMYSGRWAGTMCLTEPDAGSDVGWARTRAVPADDGQPRRIYRLQGTKQYISGGQQDLTENIIHLVLGRIEGASPGTKGLSLFIVPKIWVEADGSLGPANDVVCTGIERKMGMHGSATCSLVFGEQGRCRGLLLGEPGSGIAKMFQMMNEARVMCGVQALGLAAAAYDTARRYARERIQGTPFGDSRGERVAIVHHEDIRRMLMHLKAGTEGMRALIGKTLFLLDLAAHAPTAAERQSSQALADLLIPVVKAYCTDLGYQLTREAIQILGGAGYCQEFPVEQLARDSKILSLVEGTNYIQALDFVSRKMAMADGAIFRGFVAGIQDFAARHRDHPVFGTDFGILSQAGACVLRYAERRQAYLQDGRFRLVPLQATRFLDCFGEYVLGGLLLEQGLLAEAKLPAVPAESAEGLFYRGKVQTARFFCRNILTNVFGRHRALELEDTSALEMPVEGL